MKDVTLLIAENVYIVVVLACNALLQMLTLWSVSDNYEPHMLRVPNVEQQVKSLFLGQPTHEERIVPYTSTLARIKGDEVRFHHHAIVRNSPRDQFLAQKGAGRDIKRWYSPSTKKTVGCLCHTKGYRLHP